MSIATAKRFTIAEYHRLTQLGFFGEDDRIELIEGQLIHRAAKGTAHYVCQTRLERELFKLMAERATLRGQQPIILPDDSEPEPDRRACKIGLMIIYPLTPQQRIYCY
jgi:hypothetical protein